MRVLRGLGLGDLNALISSNGAVSRMLGGNAELIDRTHMSKDVALALFAHLGEYRNALVVTFDKVGADGDDARGALVVEELDDLHTSIDKWMIANAPYIAQVRPIEDCLAAEEPIQMMLCGTVERMRRAETRLLELEGVSAVGAAVPGTRVTLARTEYPGRDLSIVDILPGGCSKGAAVLRFAAGKGIAAGEIMAIGDNWNDLSMLEVAGFPVLMGNAPAELKALGAARGWPVTGSNHEDGVADVVEPLLPVAVVGGSKG
jgi:hydroxymethylpyrimidine pyrophosphatase-like HAD family hydrolase